MNAKEKPYYASFLPIKPFNRILIFFASMLACFWLTNTALAFPKTVLEQTFVRGTGKPTTESVGFAVPVSGEGNLKIVNGQNGGMRISSASISLNGKEIVGPDKFNQNVATIEVPITLLKGENTLGVKLTSNPGGNILAQITVEIKDPFQVFQDFKDTSEYELIVLPSGRVVEAAKDQILIYFEEDATFAEVAAVVNKISDLGGDIVGALKSLLTLQVSIPASGSELAFIQEIEFLSGVQGASLNEVVGFQNDNNDNLTGYQNYLNQINSWSQTASRAIFNPSRLLMSYPEFNGNYWIDHIKADKAWEITRGSTDEKAKIGIVDTGYWADQTILEDSRLERYDSQGKPISDDDTKDAENGFHGRWVIGFAAGYHGTSPAIRGVAQLNKVISVDVGTLGDTTCTFFGLRCLKKTVLTDLDSGFDTAINKGGQIINLSFNAGNIDCNSTSSERKDALKTFRSNADIHIKRAKRSDRLIIFAAGNACEKEDNDVPVEDSGWYSHALIVGATDENKNDWQDSGSEAERGTNMGKVVNILAPGARISFGYYDTLLERIFGTKTANGTSFSAPMVTGVAALVKSINTSLSAPEVRRVLIDSASHDVNTIYEPKLLLNAEGALNIAKSLPSAFGDGDLPPIFLAKGETKQVQFDVTVPETTVSSMDVLFLIDTTGSYGDDINSLQLKANEIITNLSSRGIDVQFGVASFADFPFSPYGSSSGGDKAYYLNQPITSDIDAVKAGIESLDKPLHYGADGPESQLEALYQAATGQGRDLNGDGLYNGLGEIEPSNAGWRTGALKLIILATDAQFHDSAVESGYPGAPFNTVEAILKEKGITVIGLDSGYTGGDLQKVVSATGGSLFALSGDSSGIAEAIAQAITNQLREVDLSIEKVAEGRWITNIEPPIYEKVAPGETRTFTLTLAGLKNIGFSDQRYDVYLWVKGNNSALLKRVHIPIRIPGEI